jgi:charged multivesicular body protein 4A/B
MCLVATSALRRKKIHEGELDKLAGTKAHLERQIFTIEAATLNAESMAALKRGADALKVIHGNL